MRILVAGMVLVLTLAVSMMVAVNTDAQGQSGVTVFVDGSTVSSFSGSGSPWGGGSIGGTTEPQTIEVMKQLAQVLSTRTHYGQPGGGAVSCPARTPS